MMRFQFTLRSLVLFVLFVSVVLSALSCGFGPMLGMGGGAFWLTLLIPFWVPQFFVAAEIRQREKIRPLVGITAAMWYYALIFLFHFARMTYVPPFLCKVVGIAGTLVVCFVLFRPRQRWWGIIVAPLVFTIVSSTIWLVVHS